MSRTMRTQLTAALLVAACAVLAAGPPAQAASQNIVTVAFTFLPPEITLERGGTLDYTNVDVAPHNVVSRVTAKNGSPLFGSATVTAGTTVPVKGVEKLKAGAYDFWCTLHPSMTGTLFVDG